MTTMVQRIRVIDSRNPTPPTFLFLEIRLDGGERGERGGGEYVFFQNKNKNDNNQ